MNDRFFEIIINSSLDSIFAFDRECRLTVWNPGMEYFFGVGKAEVIGKYAFDVLPFLNEVGEDKYIFEALAGKTVIAKERPYTIPITGQAGFFESRYCPLREDSGEVIGGMAIIRDVTEHKQIKDELFQRNDELLSLQFAAATITSSLDLHTVLNTVTREMTNLLDVIACTILEWDQTSDAVSIMARHGSDGWWDQREMQEDRFLTDLPLTRQVLDERLPLQITESQPNVDPVALAYMQQNNLKTLLILPMEFHDRVVGLVNLMDDRVEHTFTIEKIALVQMLANQAASAIENARLYAEAQRRLKEQTALRAAGAAISSTLDLEEVLVLIAKQMVKAIGVSGCTLSQWDQEADTVTTWIEWRGQGTEWTDEPRNAYALDNFPTTRAVLERREPITIQATDPDVDPAEVVLMRQTEIVSLLMLPLAVGERVIGLVELDEKERPRNFTLAEIDLCQALAEQAAIAIQNARLFEMTKQHLAELEAVRQASLSLTSSLELQAVLETILKSTLTLLNDAQNAHIFLYQAEYLTFGAALWADGRRGQPVAEPRRDGLTYAVARQGQPVVVPDMRTHPLYTDAPPDWEGAIVGLPLKMGQQVVGVMNVSYQQPRNWPEAELRILQLLADQAAIAIQNARLYEQAQQEINERKRAEEALHYRLEFEELIATISTDFINLTSAEIDHGINRALQALGEFTGVDRSYVFLLSKDGNLLDNTHEWCGKGIEPQIDNLKGLPVDILPWWMQKLGCLETIYIPRVIDLPPEASAEKEFLEAQDIQSLIVVPMAYAGSLIGFLGFDSVRAERTWSEDIIKLLKIAGEIFVNALQRKQAEEALRESEQEFQTILNSITDYVWSADIVEDQVLYRYYSPVVERITGYPPGYFMAGVDAWLNIIHPEDRAWIKNDVVRETSGELVTHEYRIIRPDGQVKWLYGTTSPTLDEMGNIIRLAGVVSDITKRKQVEAELNAYQERLEALYEVGQTITAPLKLDVVLDLIARSTADLLETDTGVILLLDETGETLSIKGAYGLSETIKKGTRVRVGERIAGRVVQMGEPIIAHDLPNNPRFYHPSTEKEGLLACASVPLIVGEKIIGTLDVHSKVDPYAFGKEHIRTLNMLASQAAIAIENARLYEALQKANNELEMRVQMRTIDLERAMAEIAEARDRTDAILRSVADGLIVTDLEHKLVLANPAAETLLGFQVQEVLGKEIGANIKDDRLREIVRGTLNRQTSGYEVDVEFEEDPRNGRQRVMRARTALVDDQQGQPFGTVTLIQDVTRLREIDRLKTELLTTAAHELRTPLTSILGFSEILLERDLDRTRRERYLQLINEQSAHLARIIEDLLDVSRLEAGRDLDLKLELVDMAKLMKEVVIPFAEMATGHDIRVDDLTELPPLMGDPFRLSQVGRNLLSNAIKYSPQGGTVNIRGRVVSDFLEISVQDEGVGMTLERQEHLFEPFYRADSSNTSISGTGLGLAICRLIVEQHGGKIWLESKSGAGTTVYFTLPLADGHAS